MAPDDFLRTVAQARNAASQERWDDAARLWEAVVNENPVQAEFWMELGDARFQAGSHDPAIESYRLALELGAGFPFDVAYQIACCHAPAGRLDDALAWLERAFTLGYRDLERAATDDAFAGLRDNPRYRKLVALIDLAAFSRDEGWRYDLALVAREVKRKASHPFRKVSEEEFDRAVQTLHDAIPHLTEIQILVELRKLLTLLGDGHAGMYIPDDHALAPVTLPIQLYRFEEGLFIIASTSEHTGLLGSQVLRIGDHSVNEVFEALAPTIPRDNDHWLKLVIPYSIRELPMLHAMDLIPDPEQVELTLMALDGREHAVTLLADRSQSTDELAHAFPYPTGWRFFPETFSSPLPRYLRNQAANYWFEHLRDEGTIYFQFNRVRDDPAENLANFTARLFRFIEDHAVERLVIDVRWNNGGNTFLEMPLIHGLIGSRLNQRGRLFAIIGRRTFSAAQNFVSMLERHTEVVFAGEPTGSSPNFVGESIEIKLPYSKLWMNVSDLYWQSSWPMDHRTWVAPLLYAPPTFAAYRENRDPALDAILAWRDHLPGA